MDSTAARRTDTRARLGKARALSQGFEGKFGEESREDPAGRWRTAKGEIGFKPVLAEVGKKLWWNSDRSLAALREITELSRNTRPDYAFDLGHPSFLVLQPSFPPKLPFRIQSMPGNATRFHQSAEKVWCR